MTPYPKHYLAEVPQNLRLRLLDLCRHHRWEDALTLLNAEGFPQYEWYELTWFYWHAPTELDPTSAISLSAPIALSSESETTPNSKLQTPNSDFTDSKPESLNSPVALTSKTLTAVDASRPDGNLNPQTSHQNLNSLTPVKVRKPRSKVAKLPEEIQQNLNALLNDGQSYAKLIQWLNAHGYSGFNKVNIHNWRNRPPEKDPESRTGAPETTAPTHL